MLIRSWLYVPGTDAGKLEKALARGADAVIADLEDAVPATDKDTARALVRDWLDGLDPRQRGRVWVRVNSGELRAADVAALADVPGLGGLCLAKTESADEVAEVDRVLSAAGSAAQVAPLLETPGAVLDALSIARAPRVRHLQIGEADLRASLGVEPGPDGIELLHVRSQIVLVSAAAGIARPVAPVSVVYNDPQALRASTAALRRLGFSGRACIHPAQIPVVNEVFTPTEEEVRRARKLLEQFEAAGSGAAAAGDGSMVDEAVARAARAVIATHEALTARP